ncbi:DUF6273 domain-containing protein [Eubacterium xylanophilum]|uniref:DUF6273 domain-containing protein n=1 Tax=Eubacterium xylanophilum TaxID=39497 RepID=UPI001A982F1B|nr:DUF6273 domain-containing protein [Eubacterium xylanophilum]
MLCTLFLNHSKVDASLQQGDKEITHVYFGNYWQTDAGKKEPIEWELKGVKNNVAFLQSAKILEYMVYDDTWSGNSTWATSFCRQWLNNKFLFDAFNARERSMLKQVLQDEYRKQDLSTVYLSGIFEGYAIKATNYALRKYPGMDPYVWWITNLWIQSEGRKVAYSTVEDTIAPGVYVGYWKTQEGNTLTVRNVMFGIRPAIYLDISKADWKTSRFRKKNIETNEYEKYKIEYLNEQDKVGVETVDTEYPNQIGGKSQSVSNGGVIKYKIKKPSIVSAKRSKSKSVIQWKKTDDSTSYDLWYSTSKKFTKKKTKKIKLTKTKYTIKKLNKKKKYYVKVRGKLKVDRISANGKWSKVKVIKRK